MTKTKVVSPTPDDKGSKKFLNKLAGRLQKELNARKERRSRRVRRSYPKTGKPALNYFTALNLPVAAAFVAVCLIVGYVYSLTAGVYVTNFARLGAETQIVQIHLGSEMVSNWPLIGWLASQPIRLGEFIVNSWQTNSYGVLGLCIYIILQANELIPTVIWESPGLILLLIDRLDRVRAKTAHHKGDSDFIRRMKERHNQYYDNLIQSLDDLKLISFGVDILICFLFIQFIVIDSAPNGDPILGSFLEGTKLYDFGWHRFDPYASFQVLSSLFLLWLLTKLAMKIFNGFQMFAKREEKQDV